MYRTFEIRQGQGGVIEGVAVPYDEITARIQGGLREKFAPGSVEIDSPAVVHFDHLPGAILGREGAGLSFEDTTDGLLFRLDMRAPLSDVQERAKANVASGILGYASVTFRAIETRMENGVRVITKALLPAISLVSHPAYAGAKLRMRGAGGLAIDDHAPDISAIGAGALEYRQGVLSGLFRFGIPSVTSLQRRQALLLEADVELAFAPTGVVLIDGLDYTRRFASSLEDAGSLIVERQENGIAFATVPNRLRNSPIFQDVQRNIEAGLTRGLLPGIVADEESFDEVDIGGQIYRQRTVKRGGVCELYLLARGDASGYAGSLQTRRAARQNWRRRL